MAEGKRGICCGQPAVEVKIDGPEILNRNRSNTMKYLILTLISLTLMSEVAKAQGIVFDTGATEACLDRAGDVNEAQNCAGSSASVCMGATPEGSSTVGMGACLTHEYDYWDGRLNHVYGLVRNKMAAEDAALVEAGISAASKTEALRDMQRAWIGYRDGLCGFERSKWDGGTGGGPAQTTCLLHETARQVFVLNQNLGSF